MENNSRRLYNGFSDLKLFELLLKGEENIGAEAYTGIVSILEERGHSNSPVKIREKVLNDYMDEQLINIVESEEGSYGKDTVKIAEMILGDRGYEVLDEDDQNVADIQEESIELIKKKRHNRNELRLYTYADIRLYADTDLSKVIRIIPKGSVVTYQRELIRKGRELILIMDKDKNKQYILNDFKYLTLCNQLKLKRDHRDVLLMDFEDYNKYRLSLKVRRRETEWYDARSITEGEIKKEETGIFVSTVCVTEKGGKKVLQTNKLGFNTELGDKIKMARLSAGSNFYTIGEEKKGEANKIVLDDGRSGIMLSSLDSLEIIDPPLESFVRSIGMIIYLIVMRINS